MQDKVTQAWRSSVYNPTMPTKKLRKNFYIHILDTFLGGQIIFPTQANENIEEKEPLPTKKNNLHKEPQGQKSTTSMVQKRGLAVQHVCIWSLRALSSSRIGMRGLQQVLVVGLCAEIL